MTVYATPTLQRFGYYEEFMAKLAQMWKMAGGCLAFSDGANPYHRYNPEGATCGFPNG